VKSIADGAQRFLVPTPAALRLPDDGLLRNPSAGSLAGGKPENQHIHAWLKVKNQNKTDRPFHHVRPWTPDFGGKATPLTIGNQSTQNSNRPTVPKQTGEWKSKLALGC
jgi:hypothetical protein